MKSINSFFEFTGNPNHQSIRESIDSLDADDRPYVVAYLNAGIVYEALNLMPVDVVTGERPAGNPHVRATDGEFVWDRNFAYYVERYGVSPDPSFVEKAVSFRGIPPEPTPKQRASIRSLVDGKMIL